MFINEAVTFTACSYRASNTSNSFIIIETEP